MPTHLYGYGSYGICMDPSFSSSRFALVDRGICYAIAHVRGGGEMGHNLWYGPASCGCDDFREISSGETMKNRCRRAW